MNNYKSKRLYKKYSHLEYPDLIREAIELEERCESRNRSKRLIKTHKRNRISYRRQAELIERKLKDEDFLEPNGFKSHSSCIERESLRLQLDSIYAKLDKIDMKLYWSNIYE